MVELVLGLVLGLGSWNCGIQSSIADPVNTHTPIVIIFGPPYTHIGLVPVLKRFIQLARSIT